MRVFVTVNGLAALSKHKFNIFFLIVLSVFMSAQISISPCICHFTPQPKHNVSVVSGAHLKTVQGNDKHISPRFFHGVKIPLQARASYV